MIAEELAQEWKTWANDDEIRLDVASTGAVERLDLANWVKEGQTYIQISGHPKSCVMSFELWN